MLFAGNASACSTAAWVPGASGVVEANNPANGVVRVGGECGLKVTGAGYVQDNSPSAEDHFFARFYFFPQLSGTGNIPVFTAYSDEATSVLFSVMFDGTNLSVDATPASGGTSSPVAVVENQWQLVEVSWQSGVSGGLWLNTDATLEDANVTFSPGAGVVESVRLGAPDAFGGLSGQMYFDDYESHRETSVGPLPNFDAIVAGHVEPDARNLIESFYLDVLDRGPEPGAVDGWYNGYFQYGLSFNIDVLFVPREMARVFFLSAEYAARNRTDEEFIRDCYQVFLNRQPSAGELAGWLSGTWQRAPVLSLFSESQEFGDFMKAMFPGSSGDSTRNFVTTMYIGLLDRLVDSGGLEYQTGQFNQAYANGGIEGVRVEAVIFGQTVLASAEYLSQSPTNGTHVIRFYRAYLGRYPSESEFNYWVGELNSGRETTDSVMNQFANSPEFTTKLNTYFGSP
jgi:hypothetical protein